MQYLPSLLIAATDIGGVATNTEHLIMRIAGAVLAIILIKHLLKHYHDMSPGGIVGSIALGVIAAAVVTNPGGVVTMLKDTAHTIHFGG